MVFDYHLAPKILRQYLQEELVKKRWKQKELAEAAGIDCATISNIFNHKQSLMLPQLHAINQAFGLPNDAFYELFIGECCGDNGRFKPEKTSDFLLHCILVEKYEIVKQIVQLLHEESSRSKMIDTTFKIAEYIFQSDKRNYSLPFYDIITQNGYSRSEKLAISYYRRFLILRDLDTCEAGNEALCQLIEYLPLLPDDIRLDAYYRILTFYNVVENWPKLLLYAQELRSIALAEGNNNYVAESWLYESMALKGMKNFEGALKATKAYRSYGDHYAWLSKCNELYISIEMKRIEPIEELMGMLKGPQALLVLPVALDSYLSNNALIEARGYLEKYKSYVDDLLSRKDPFHLKHKLRLTQALSQYYFRCGQYDTGFEYNAASLKMALNLKNMHRVGMAVVSFQEHEKQASAEHKERFINILLSMNHDLHGSFLVQYYRSVVAG
ncbi:helix-turn-helix domain-containing protein [Paenibacillus dendritiformis]|uniref:helix-turn-helix domain-containing protein n=1 Tax=Paenibacillus dendritiformis TaxID=130049 RepID=UPI0018CE1C62|nr:helix-turn-helix transcriptional regulator [Paenibacillus dendritiformis]